MTIPTQTPADAIRNQIDHMQQAIARLTATIDELTSEIDPDKATWKDVGTYGKEAYLALHLVSEMDEL